MKNASCAKSGGFTLVELIVAMGVSALVLVFLTRLFSASLSGSTLQEQISDMNQNARYAIRELGDLLMQSGADLQITYLDTLDKDTVILPDGGKAACSGFTIKINPYGGILQVPQTNHAAICSLDVNDARKYRGASQLQRIPGIRSGLPLKVYSLVRVDTVVNRIYFSPADSFLAGDAVCPFMKKRFFLNGTNLCIDNTANIIAENIDSLAIVFLDKNNSPVSAWRNMRSVSLLVRARTALPDKKYNGFPDHYRRLTLTYKCRMRNRSAQ
jgi:prepilin-type N-terminal cleavage/methylation domain-containing protein